MKLTKRATGLRSAEAERLANDVDRIGEAVAPLVASEDHVAAALALALLAAKHVYHDGASREDFLRVCTTAWNVVEKAHKNGRCSH